MSETTGFDELVYEVAADKTHRYTTNEIRARVWWRFDFAPSEKQVRDSLKRLAAAGRITMDRTGGAYMWEVISEAEKLRDLRMDLLTVAVAQPDQVRAWMSRHGMGNGEVTGQMLSGAMDRDHEEALEVNAVTPGQAAQKAALLKMCEVLGSWIEGAKENHEALDHPSHYRGKECWSQFAPEDIRGMIKDAADDLGISGFAP